MGVRPSLHDDSRHHRARADARRRMHASIDLSTPGVIALARTCSSAWPAGSNGRLAPAILACLGVGAAVGLVKVFIGILRLNPDRDAGGGADRSRAGPEVLAWDYGPVERAGGTVVLDGRQATGHQLRVLDGRRDHGRRCTRASLHSRRTALSSRRANPTAAWMAGLRIRMHVVFAYTARESSTQLQQSCLRVYAPASTRPSAPRTCSRRSPPSSSPARRSRAGWQAQPRPGWQLSRSRC